MTATYSVTADSIDRARQIAVNRAHADGWRTILAVFVHQTSWNTYDVDVSVANLHRP